MNANHAWGCSIELPSDFSLEEVHLAIQNALEFDDDHMYEFSISNSIRGKNVSEYTCDSDEIYKTTIENILESSKGKKIYYLFDYGDNWVFQISRSRKKPFTAELDTFYPRVIDESGVKPIQYPDWEE
ncbi:hypothetical protein [Thalassotalea sp. PP2-459]|uniref:IS1096 element passenger TnpR family protein n=1 Tax=Thalassotalea sp. PP2-459 TaxID=1742724 RepID=UPI00158813C9|nr:hypothetical protein [Thalassotalea sp. PP2-459]